MTYIVGIKKYGITAIIADTQVSYIKGRSIEKSKTFALKSGALFKGCIFGAAGDSEAILHFLISWHNVQSDYHYDEADLRIPWAMFKSLILTYPFDEDKHFQLILSSLAEGSPELYIMDTKKNPKLQKVQKDIITIGDGKNLLDSRLIEFHKRYADIYCKPFTKDKEMRRCYPYIYCAWLMARVQGEDALKLEKYGVGGHFHFCLQTKQGSIAPAPAIYINYSRLERWDASGKDMDDKTYLPIEVNPSISRICYINNGNSLVVEHFETMDAQGDRHFIHGLNSQMYLTEDYGNVSSEEAKDILLLELEGLPLYTFCCFTFADPNFDFWIEYCIMGDDGKHEPIISRKNNLWCLSEDRIKYVEDSLTKSFNNAITKPEKFEIKVFHALNP